MSALKRIRENVGLVIVLIAISLFAFIFTDLFRSIQGGPDNTVAEVNGSSIAYDVLDRKYNMVERTSNPANTPEEIEQLREQAWQSLVREFVYNAEWGSAGISYSADEEDKMLRGQIYDPFVIRSGYFNDSLGNYSPAMVDAVKARFDEISVSDPQIHPDWKKWKQGLIDLLAILQLDRMSTKWQRMISGAMLVSDNEATRTYNDVQRTANFSYVSVPYSSISDSAVAVGDGDYSDYYNKHRERFKRDAEVQFQYTYFPIRPSSKDSAESHEALSGLIKDFADAESPFDFAFTNSDLRNIDTTLKPAGELPAELQATLGSEQKVVGPIRVNEGYRLMRIAETVEDSIRTSVKMRHILVRIAGSTREDTIEARNKARDLRNQVNADMPRFAEIAITESDDQLTKGNGGDLGWLLSNAYGPDFEDDIKNANSGSAVIAESALGFHVVEVQDRTNKLYSVAELTRAILPSTITTDSIYKRASAYHGEALGGADLVEALSNYPEGFTQLSGVLGTSSTTLLGLTGARPIINWGFKSAEGQINEELLESKSAFVIAKITYRGDKGYKSLDNVRAEIEREVINRVKAKTIKAKLASASGADMNAVAAGYGPDARAGSVTAQSFSNNLVSGIGNEPKVVGRAFGLQIGTASKPIAGNNGVYVIKVETINEPAAFAPAAMAQQKTEATRAKSDKAINASFQGLLDLAQIRDYRYNFGF